MNVPNRCGDGSVLRRGSQGWRSNRSWPVAVRYSTGWKSAIVNCQLTVAGKDLEVAIQLEERCALADRDGGDQAVDHPPYRLTLAATGSIQGSGELEIRRAAAAHLSSSEKSTQLLHLTLIPGSGQNLRKHGVGDANIRLQQAIDRFADV